MKSKIGKNSNKSTNIELLKHDNNEIKDLQDITNHLNSFFTEIVPKLANNLSHPIVTHPEPPITTNKSSFFIIPTTDLEVLSIINNLKNKSGGVDNINTNIIKIIGPFIVSPLTNIFNKIFESGIFPQHFKTAEVIPIYKSGDKKLATNYRPIALTSNLAKILEKLIHVRLINYLNKHNNLSKKGV